VFGILSFAFPKIPDTIRYTSLAIAAIIGAYHVFKSYMPLDAYARAYRANGRVYGFKYEILDVRAVMDEDGAADISRKVKLASTSPELGEVEHYLMVPGSEEESGGALPLDVGEIHCEDPLYRLTAEKRKATPSRLNLVVKFKPSLSKHRSVEYTLPETAPEGTFVLVESDLAEGIEYEFFA